MIFQKAYINDFDRIKNFYWDLIDEIQDQNDVIGWKKGIYTHGRVPAGESAAGRAVHAGGGWAAIRLHRSQQRVQ